MNLVASALWIDWQMIEFFLHDKCYRENERIQSPDSQRSKIEIRDEACYLLLRSSPRWDKLLWTIWENLRVWLIFFTPEVKYIRCRWFDNVQLNWIVEQWLFDLFFIVLVNVSRYVVWSSLVSPSLSRLSIRFSQFHTLLLAMSIPLAVSLSLSRWIYIWNNNKFNRSPRRSKT